MTDERILESFRRWGHLAADLDILRRIRPTTHPDIEVEGPAADRARAFYCRHIGVEFMHMIRPERCAWIAERMEMEPAAPDRARILERLIRADTFERVLQTRYIGVKRYSLEGSDALIPVLDEMLAAALDQKAEHVVLGMSHRGRLNVMAHTVGKSPAGIFAGFEDVDPRSVLGGGDVKYHLGATGTFEKDGAALAITLVSNPSHLEAVYPVVIGRARAKARRTGDLSGRKVLPIVLHGDAAFAGQGVVAETLNMAGLSGYSVGGTVHVIVNNLIGFTTTPRDLHTSRYSSDLARRLDIPIFHANGQHPEAAVRAARLALEYRYAFGSDVVLDLIGFRRHGHSEVEDPTATQPGLYECIASLPPLWKSYAEAIGVPEAEAEASAAAVRARLDEEQEEAKAMTRTPVLRKIPAYWDPYRGGPWTPDFEVDTGVSAERLGEITAAITRWPEGFNIHPKVRRLLEQRREMGEGKRPVDWGMAEALAFGSLLRDGIPVRLSGQDSRRGTFNQRVAVLVDTWDQTEIVPLEHLDPEQAWFAGCDSPLSEFAVAAFEYGFSRDYPEALVLWEAQFGDFANGAQVVIDQFIAATEDKWKLLSGLVLLLPHGYEGQGPEHSSARLERYLQLAAEDNMQVCQPSTAAQYFHLLRRQVMRRWRKPLVVMTPKSLLRAARAASPLSELTEGRFRVVLPDPAVERAERLLLCTGKVAYELEAEREKRGDKGAAVVRLEQLYPFPERDLAAELARHPGLREVVWVQEEPANMGALFYVMPFLRRLAGEVPVRSVKRSASASPATSSMKAHAMEQAALLALAFVRGQGVAEGS